VAQAFTIQFNDTQIARAASVSDHAPSQEVIALLGLQRAPAAITIHAGAAGASPEIVNDLHAMFHDELAPLANRYGIAMLDGGTASGVVGMMGVARQAINGTFPLIGVAPLGQVTFPGYEVFAGPNSHSPLEPNHTHFALVDGNEWGDESWILINLTRQLSLRRIVLVINGGDIVRQEALMHAQAGNDLLVMAGSGRVSDEIVKAIADGKSDDPLISKLLKTRRARICTPDTVIQMLLDTLGLRHKH
jgi:SLOG in TRPM, prokaryote